jgi:hypothetical protein
VGELGRRRRPAQQAGGERHQRAIVRRHPLHPVGRARRLRAQRPAGGHDVVDQAVGVLQVAGAGQPGDVREHGVQSAGAYGQAGLLGELAHHRVAGVLALLDAAAGQSP